MRIVVFEVNTTAVRQKLTTGAKPVMVSAIRPYIYKHLAPAGSVYLQIQDSAGNKIKDSEVIAISTLSVSNYFHGFYRFLVNFGFAANTTYYIELKTTGYTYASNAFVGWCSSFDLQNSIGVTYSPSSGFSAPLGLQLWSYDHVTKGDY